MLTFNKWIFNFLNVIIFPTLSVLVYFGIHFNLLSVIDYVITPILCIAPLGGIVAMVIHHLMLLKVHLGISIISTILVVIESLYVTAFSSDWEQLVTKEQYDTLVYVLFAIIVAMILEVYIGFKILELLEKDEQQKEQEPFKQDDTQSVVVANNNSKSADV